MAPPSQKKKTISVPRPSRIQTTSCFWHTFFPLDAKLMVKKNQNATFLTTFFLVKFLCAYTQQELCTKCLSYDSICIYTKLLSLYYNKFSTFFGADKRNTSSYRFNKNLSVLYHIVFLQLLINIKMEDYIKLHHEP